MSSTHFTTRLVGVKVVTWVGGDRWPGWSRWIAGSGGVVLGWPNVIVGVAGRHCWGGLTPSLGCGDVVVQCPWGDLTSSSRFGLALV